MKRLSAAMLLLLLSVVFTIGGSLAYDNAVYGENTEGARGVIEQNNVMSAGSFNVNVSEESFTENKPFTVQNFIGFKSQNWEPGYADAGIINVMTSVPVKYDISVSVADLASLTDLADVIDVYYTTGDVTTIGAKVDFVTSLKYAGTVREVINGKDSNDNTHKIFGTLDEKNVAQPISLVFKMRESAGNHYQDMALCSGGFTVTCTVTQTQ